MDNQHEFFMKQALCEAEKAQANNEVPIGAVVVRDNQVIGCGFNQVIMSCDPTAHAEVVALRQAAETVGNYRLVDCQLYVTLEPCMMCLGAMVHARLSHVYYATNEPKAGVVCSQAHLHEASFLNHRLNITGGILADKASKLLRDFFRQRRLAKKQ
ncbi:tRNA adenosine(34) deaminase TadA [Facilibium subflavum]|uniref:tRNA adenosine(34) deaminase TadA n=1 Tax=Facilibium subflavum TaxID=2219058 RepID=UPI000E645FDD|nr:tRNA adenosine(34) deaminase TadA [Facilibium subflavum]